MHPTTNPLVSAPKSIHAPYTTPPKQFNHPNSLGSNQSIDTRAHIAALSIFSKVNSCARESKSVFWRFWRAHTHTRDNARERHGLRMSRACFANNSRARCALAVWRGARGDGSLSLFVERMRLEMTVPRNIGICGEKRWVMRIKSCVESYKGIWSFLPWNFFKYTCYQTSWKYKNTFVSYLWFCLYWIWGWVKFTKLLNYDENIDGP